MITSKEALEQIMEKYIFYVPARSEGKEHLMNCLNIIAKDIERLEKLNNIFSDSHICEIRAKFNEIECNSDKCKTCPLGVGDGICLNNVFEHKWELEKENAKLKQAIDILKDKYSIALHLEYTNTKLLGLDARYFLKNKKTNDKRNFIEINEKEYKLLKEVLGE